MKQSAVEWLVQQTPNMHWEDGYWADLFERAKEMEKQQIIDFSENYELYESDKYPRKTFEQYYNEIFLK